MHLDVGEAPLYTFRILENYIHVFFLLVAFKIEEFFLIKLSITNEMIYESDIWFIENYRYYTYLLKKKVFICKAVSDI